MARNTSSLLGENFEDFINNQAKTGKDDTLLANLTSLLLIGLIFPI